MLLAESGLDGAQWEFSRSVLSAALVGFVEAVFGHSQPRLDQLESAGHALAVLGFESSLGSLVEGLADLRGYSQGGLLNLGLVLGGCFP